MAQKCAECGTSIHRDLGYCPACASRNVTEESFLGRAMPYLTALLVVVSLSALCMYLFRSYFWPTSQP